MQLRRWREKALALSLALTAIWALSLTLCGVASAEDDLDDLMGGFDDDFDASEIGSQDEEIHPWLAALPFGDVLAERVDLSGSLSSGVVYNYRPHSVTHGDDMLSSPLFVIVPDSSKFAPISKVSS